MSWDMIRNVMNKDNKNHNIIDKLSEYLLLLLLFNI